MIITNQEEAEEYRKEALREFVESDHGAEAHRAYGVKLQAIADTISRDRLADTSDALDRADYRHSLYAEARIEYGVYIKMKMGFK